MTSLGDEELAEIEKLASAYAAPGAWHMLIAEVRRLRAEVAEREAAGWSELAGVATLLGYARGESPDFGEVDVVDVRALAARIRAIAEQPADVERQERIRDARHDLVRRDAFLRAARLCEERTSPDAPGVLAGVVRAIARDIRALAEQPATDRAEWVEHVMALVHALSTVPALPGGSGYNRACRTLRAAVERACAGLDPRGER